MQNITITKQDTYTITFNKGYIFSWHGGLKIAQFLLGLTCLLLVLISSRGYIKSVEFFVIVAVAFLIGTFCHIFAEMFASKNVVSGITDTARIFRSHAAELMYGYIYNGLAAVMYITASGIILSSWGGTIYTAAIIGMINGILYTIATILNGKY